MMKALKIQEVYGRLYIYINTITSKPCATHVVEIMAAIKIFCDKLLRLLTNMHFITFIRNNVQNTGNKKTR